MKTTKVMPPAYTLISLIAMVILHFVFPGAIVIPIMWRLLGIIFVIAGVAVSIVAEGKFHEAGTTVTPFEESSALVTNGIYEFTRNPMYLGFVMVLLGVAILLGSLTSFAIIILFGIVMKKFFIEIEEKMLGTRFGSQWTKYKTSVRRWL